MKKLSLYKKFLIAGVVLVGVFNPLAVAFWSDGLVVAINFIAAELVAISQYTVIIGATLLFTSLVLYLDQRSKKETKRLKKLSHKSSAKAGEYLA